MSEPVGDHNLNPPKDNAEAYEQALEDIREFLKSEVRNLKDMADDYVVGLTNRLGVEIGDTPDDDVQIEIRECIEKLEKLT